MNKKAKRIWERHYTALNLKFKNRGSQSVAALLRLDLALYRIEKLLRKG